MIVKYYDDGYVDYVCEECKETKKVKLASLKKYNRLEVQYCRKCTIKFNNVVEKRKKTCLDKYGYDNPMKLKTFTVKKIKNTTDLYDRQRNDFEDVKKSFEDEGYTLLSTEYKNRNSKLQFVCPKGHKHYITWSSWRRGSRCNLCSIENTRYTLDFIKDLFKKEDYELLSTEYTNSFIPITYKCPKGHTGTIRLHHWIHHNHRCSSCSHIESKAELEIKNLVSTYCSDIIYNDRELISPLELDIVIPSKKIAIEYCGLYWHSEANGKNKNYHLNKLQKCNKLGYILITIFEDEWIYKRDIVISRLLYKLNVANIERVSARKCFIKEIEASVKNKFLNENHIQGADTAKVKLGAFYKDKLISVMTFGKPNISRVSNYEWELNRFCTDKNIVSAGIAPKLFKHFIRTYSPNSIVTYGDKRWSTGNLYKYLGFKYSHSSVPSYWYVDKNKRMHRYNFRKSVLHTKLKKFNISLTEKENMRNNGYQRIYDCGNVVWVYQGGSDVSEL